MLDRDQSYTSESRHTTDRPITWTKTLPPDLPPERLRALIVEYEAPLDDWDQDCISVGYCYAVIAEAKSLLADRRAA